MADSDAEKSDVEEDAVAAAPAPRSNGCGEFFTVIILIHYLSIDFLGELASKLGVAPVKPEKPDEKPAKKDKKDKKDKDKKKKKKKDKGKGVS